MIEKQYSVTNLYAFYAAMAETVTESRDVRDCFLTNKKFMKRVSKEFKDFSNGISDEPEEYFDKATSYYKAKATSSSLAHDEWDGIDPFNQAKKPILSRKDNETRDEVVKLMTQAYNPGGLAA